ncbi:glucokinase [Poseidonocella pacifica]|uniref:Glucokinase n=1 Tax=Poseidonocella pacifica TaxID=871651 RepID=A0A1I0V1J5_9RHOB|nr:glucokinase [Poseidonocella pacifica]SFA70013.1 glucokinase [Poseidonocella pacifica]
MARPDPLHTICADVGGTNTRVAFADGPIVRQETIRRFRNADHSGIEDVLRRFLAESASTRPPEAACVAIAGPVRDGLGQLTNLNWSIDREALSGATGATTAAILNDLQAQGHSLAHLDESACETVIPAPAPAAHAACLVVGVGTGFNIAPVFHQEDMTLVPPAEAGHASLPVRDARDLRLSETLARAHGFPAVEEALSGRGVEHLYAFACAEADQTKSKTAAEIMASCKAGDDPEARESVKHFVTLLGTVCGNLALNQLPFGGVFLVGGVTRAMQPYFAEFGFAEAFRDKGRFSGFMENFGVHVVTDDYAALTGCAAHMQELLKARATL